MEVQQSFIAFADNGNEWKENQAAGEQENEFLLCNGCINGFSCAEDLENHLVFGHRKASCDTYPSKDLFICEECGETLDSQTNLSLHLQNHELTRTIDKYPHLLCSLVSPNFPRSPYVPNYEHALSSVDIVSSKLGSSTTGDCLDTGNKGLGSQSKKRKIQDTSCAKMKKIKPSSDDNSPGIEESLSPLTVATEALGELYSQSVSDDTSEGVGKAYSCPQCAGEHKTLIEFRYHIRGHGFILCTKCGEHFASHGQLIEHAKVHVEEGEKSANANQCHVCIKCGLSLATHQQLISHSRLHQQVFEVACKDITKEFYPYFKALQIITLSEQGTSGDLKEIICCPDCRVISIGKEAFGKHLIKKSCNMNPPSKSRPVYPRRKALRIEDNEKPTEIQKDVKLQPNQMKEMEHEINAPSDDVNIKIKVEEKVNTITNQSEKEVGPLSKPDRNNPWEMVSPTPLTVGIKAINELPLECFSSSTGQSVSPQMSGGESYSCPQCNEELDNVRELRYHVRSHGFLLCLTCGKHLPSHAKLLEHTMANLKKKGKVTDVRVLNADTCTAPCYVCATCGLGLSSSQLLSSHSKLHKTVCEVVCKDIQEEFYPLFNFLQIVIKGEVSGKAKEVITCPDCTMVSIGREAFGKHLIMTSCKINPLQNKYPIYPRRKILRISDDEDEDATRKESIKESVPKEKTNLRLANLNHGAKDSEDATRIKESVPKEKTNLRFANVNHGAKNPEATKCDVCQQELSNPIMVRFHKSYSCVPKNGVLVYKCEKCPRNFPAVDLLKLHLAKHVTKAWHCQFCTCSFASLVELDAHKMALHLKEAAVQEKRKAEPKSHNHGVLSRYVCEICGYTTDAVKRLQRHQGMHRK